MPFIGNQPALSYTSFAKQDFTTSATTSYTLDHPVTNENEIALFINFVRQEPTTAYSASNTTLTLTSATSASDDMYCVFLGKAVQTVNPPNGSVGTAQIADLAVTSGKLASGVLPDNTPAFMAYNSTVTSMTNNTPTKVLFQTENFDVGSCYDTSTSRFTPTTAGKYFFNASVSVNSTGNFDKNDVNFYKNGSAFASFRTYHTSYTSSHGSVIIEANGSTDYFEIYYEQNSGGALNTINNQSTFFSAYKIIE